MSDLPPVLVRISGIPRDVLTGFSSPDCLVAERHLSMLQEQSRAARAALVDELYAAIQGAPPDQRRHLLALKRDSFNGRGILGYRNHPQWSQIARLAGPLAEYTLTVEEEVEGWQREFVKAYEVQMNREQQHLKALVREPSLLRGLAFGSTDFLMNLPRLLRALTRSVGRRDRRLELSALRYVSRAAIKLSPFSYLTPVGLARLHSTEDSVQFTDDTDWRELSTVHVQRYRIEQIADLLTQHASFRDGLTVRLNPTLERLGNGIYRFLRPGSWVCPPGKGTLERQQPSLAKAKLGGGLVECLLAERWGSGRTYRDLLADLASELPEYDADVLRGSLDKSLGAGFLCFEFPWAKPVAGSEALLIEYLEQIEDPSLEPLRTDLRSLVGSLQSPDHEPSPVRRVVECRASLKRALEEASNLVGKHLQVSDAGNEWLLHEDVFLTSSRPAAEILKVPSAKAQRILADMDVLVRLSSLGHSRFDYLHSLRGFAATRWPAAKEVGFLEFFEAAFPIFQQYLAFDKETFTQWPLRRRAFNPMNLREVEQLHGHRESAAQALDGALVDRGMDVEVDLARVRDILSRVPDVYVESRDFAVFVQALQPSGNSWVLSTVVEGAGRFESRYTMGMPPELRQEWSSRYVARSVFDQGSGDAEIVDLLSPLSNTANLHVPLTARVIEFPGQPTGLSPERRLPLRDLRVRFEGAGMLPWLLDDQGRRILPSHLGSQGFRFLPGIHKFLALFGPWDLRPCFPMKDWRQRVDVRVRERHWVGNVVYRRQTWDCELGPLKAELAGRSESAAFQTISRWRQAGGLPDHVFVADPILLQEGKPLRKPQYIDFTSCLFVELFRTLLKKEVDRLEIVEALPGSEDGLARGCGGRWSAELLLDAHGLRPFGVNLEKVTELVRQGKPGERGCDVDVDRNR